MSRSAIQLRISNNIFSRFGDSIPQLFVPSRQSEKLFNFPSRAFFGAGLPIVSHLLGLVR